jgi:tetratricopeptide (TPR) repeat protein
MVPGSDIARSRQHERLDRLGRCCHVGRDAKGWIGLGDAATSAGTLREADAAFLKYIELARRTNDERAISVGLNRHGDVLEAQGNLPEALESFRDGLAIRDRLAKADPGNAGWQRGLSLSYNKIGDVLVTQGNLPEALKSFRDGLAIANRLAQADPGNAGWQRDLIVSCVKLAGIDQTGARTFLARARSRPLFSGCGALGAQSWRRMPEGARTGGPPTGIFPCLCACAG